MEILYFFKLFNNIKSKHEVVLAELELESLLETKLERISNILELLKIRDFSRGIRISEKIITSLTLELPYGMTHGFLLKSKDLFDLTKIAKRISYIKEIFIIFKNQKYDEIDIKNKIYPNGEFNINLEIFQDENFFACHIITHQFFLENS